MWSKKNSYEATEVNNGGGHNYGSDIHGATIQTNQIIWDMIKILDRAGEFGFFFTAKIAVKKTIIVMYHEDEEMLEKGKHLLHEFFHIPNVLLLAKIQKKRKRKYMKLFVIGTALLSILFGISYFVYLNKDYFIKASESLFSKEKEKDMDVENQEGEIKEQVVQIDIKKLQAMQEILADEKDPLQEKITKGMEMGVAIMSSMVSKEDKAKYSSKDLVKNFKGKNGLKFELKKDENMSEEEFQSSIKGLNGYVKNFIKENANEAENLTNNLVKESGEAKVGVKELNGYVETSAQEHNSSELINGYEKVLKSDKSASKVDKAVAYNNIGDLYIDVKEFEKAEGAFLKSLKLSKKLAKEDEITYTGCVALNLTKLSDVHKEQKRMKKSKKELDEAEKNYLKVLSIYRELAKKDSKKFQTNIAWALNMLANFYHDKKEAFKESLKYREEALEIYKKLAKERPLEFNKMLFQTFNSLAKTHSALKNLKLAKRFYLNGLALMEKELKEHKIDDNSDIIAIAMVYNSLIKIDLSQSNWKEAKERINYNLKVLKPTNQISKEVLSQTYFYLGFYAEVKNRADTALAHYLKSLKLDENFESAKAYVNILSQRKKYMKADAFFNEMFKLYQKDEQQADIWRLYGKFYLNINPDDGREKLKKALLLYDKIEKDKNSTEYREVKELIDGNSTKPKKVTMD